MNIPQIANTILSFDHKLKVNLIFIEGFEKIGWFITQPIGM